MQSPDPADQADPEDLVQLHRSSRCGSASQRGEEGTGGRRERGGGGREGGGAGDERMDGWQTSLYSEENLKSTP